MFILFIIHAAQNETVDKGNMVMPVGRRETQNAGQNNNQYIARPSRQLTMSFYVCKMEQCVPPFSLRYKIRWVFL